MSELVDAEGGRAKTPDGACRVLLLERRRYGGFLTVTQHRPKLTLHQALRFIFLMPRS